MASGPNKRASMREGPLAALFRKTEEVAGEAPVEEPPAPVREEPPVEEPRAEAAAPRRREVPHPSLAVPPVERPAIPSPQERLRHAFSSELPENLMDRPAAHAPRDDVYARGDAPSAFVAARPVGAPVIR
ncbi:MAG: cell division protein FtsZ, partial [Solirubrobacteraceae bacterium]|nr:cell division protein FtsZ [Solirubrobacteraceae bacterium]